MDFKGNSSHYGPKPEWHEEPPTDYKYQPHANQETPNNFTGNYVNPGEECRNYNRSNQTDNHYENQNYFTTESSYSNRNYRGRSSYQNVRNQRIPCRREIELKSDFSRPNPNTATNWNVDKKNWFRKRNPSNFKRSQTWRPYGKRSFDVEMNDVMYGVQYSEEGYVPIGGGRYVPGRRDKKFKPKRSITKSNEKVIVTDSELKDFESPITAVVTEMLEKIEKEENICVTETVVNNDELNAYPDYTFSLCDDADIKITVEEHIDNNRIQSKRYATIDNFNSNGEIYEKFEGKSFLEMYESGQEISVPTITSNVEEKETSELSIKQNVKTDDLTINRSEKPIESLSKKQKIETTISKNKLEKSCKKTNIVSTKSGTKDASEILEKRKSKNNSDLARNLANGASDLKNIKRMDTKLLESQKESSQKRRKVTPNVDENRHLKDRKMSETITVKINSSNKTSTDQNVSLKTNTAFKKQNTRKSKPSKLKPRNEKLQMEVFGEIITESTKNVNRQKIDRIYTVVKKQKILEKDALRNFWRRLKCLHTKTVCEHYDILKKQPFISIALKDTSSNKSAPVSQFTTKCNQKYSSNISTSNRQPVDNSKCNEKNCKTSTNSATKKKEIVSFELKELNEKFPSPGEDVSETAELNFVRDGLVTVVRLDQTYTDPSTDMDQTEQLNNSITQTSDSNTNLSQTEEEKHVKINVCSQTKPKLPSSNEGISEIAELISSRDNLVTVVYLDQTHTEQSTNLDQTEQSNNAVTQISDSNTIFSQTEERVAEEARVQINACSQTESEIIDLTEDDDIKIKLDQPDSTTSSTVVHLKVKDPFSLGMFSEEQVKIINIIAKHMCRLLTEFTCFTMYVETCNNDSNLVEMYKIIDEIILELKGDVEILKNIYFYQQIAYEVTKMRKLEHDAKQSFKVLWSIIKLRTADLKLGRNIRSGEILQTEFDANSSETNDPVNENTAIVLSDQQRCATDQGSQQQEMSYPNVNHTSAPNNPQNNNLPNIPSPLRSIRTLNHQNGYYRNNLIPPQSSGNANIPINNARQPPPPYFSNHLLPSGTSVPLSLIRQPPNINPSNQNVQPLNKTRPQKSQSSRKNTHAVQKPTHRQGIIGSQPVTIPTTVSHYVTTAGNAYPRPVFAHQQIGAGLQTNDMGINGNALSELAGLESRYMDPTGITNSTSEVPYQQIGSSLRYRYVNPPEITVTMPEPVYQQVGPGLQSRYVNPTRNASSIPELIDQQIRIGLQSRYVNSSGSANAISELNDQRIRSGLQPRYVNPPGNANTIPKTGQQQVRSGFQFTYGNPSRNRHTIHKPVHQEVESGAQIRYVNPPKTVNTFPKPGHQEVGSGLQFRYMNPPETVNTMPKPGHQEMGSDLQFRYVNPPETVNTMPKRGHQEVGSGLQIRYVNPPETVKTMPKPGHQEVGSGLQFRYVNPPETVNIMPKPGHQEVGPGLQFRYVNPPETVNTMPKPGHQEVGSGLQFRYVNPPETVNTMPKPGHQAVGSSLQPRCVNPPENVNTILKPGHQEVRPNVQYRCMNPIGNTMPEPAHQQVGAGLQSRYMDSVANSVPERTHQQIRADGQPRSVVQNADTAEKQLTHQPVQKKITDVMATTGNVARKAVTKLKTDKRPGEAKETNELSSPVVDFVKSHSWKAKANEIENFVMQAGVYQDGDGHPILESTALKNSDAKFIQEYFESGFMFPKREPESEVPIVLSNLVSTTLHPANRNNDCQTENNQKPSTEPVRVKSADSGYFSTDSLLSPTDFRPCAGCNKRSTIECERCHIETYCSRECRELCLREFHSQVCCMLKPRKRCMPAK